MISNIRTMAMMIAAAAAVSWTVGCTSEHSLVKNQDNAKAKSGYLLDNSENDQESYDFGDAGNEKARKSTDFASVGGENHADGENADSTYKRDTYYQTGMASWYGREFNGKKTASGEHFDMYGMTAAHKILPFGTIIKVKNFENGKTATVRVNDRGPYRGKRIVDLSYGAAKKLGMLAEGETRVGIKILKRGGEDEELDADGGYEDLQAASDKNENARSENRGAYAVQAGAFYSKRNAEGLKDRIEGLTGNPVVVIHDADMYKVRVRGLVSRSEAEKMRKTLSDDNIPSFMITSDE